jgi:uncharacterized membrane protein YfcA
MVSWRNRDAGARVLRTPPTPIRVDARRVIALGTAAWAIAAVVAALCWTWLGRHDHRIWLWTCLCGAVLGLLGLVLVSKHHDEGRF